MTESVQATTIQKEVQQLQGQLYQIQHQEQ
jgi:hypothetical protein